MFFGMGQCKLFRHRVPQSGATGKIKRSYPFVTSSYARRLRVEELEDRRMLAITVDTPLDVIDTGDNLTSLREAIATANMSGNGADTIDFDASLSGATIQLGGTELEITESLTIDASVLDEPVTIDAEQQSRVLNFTASSGDLVLSGLTITGGRTTGDNANFSDTTYSGGGIRFLSEGNLMLSESAVNGNSTVGNDAHGGGIFLVDGAATLADSTVSGNSTMGTNAYGGGIVTLFGTLTLTGSTISENDASGRGGGIYAPNGLVTLTGSTISENKASSNGGGVFAFNGDVTLTSSTVSGNITTSIFASGGGIFTSSGAVTLTNSTVSGNSSLGNSATGAGIKTSSGAVTLTNSTVNGNNTAGTSASGGGIHTFSGAVTLTNSTVSSNSTAGSNAPGGGINTSSGAVTLTSSTVSGNSSGADSGGIYTRKGAVTLASSTLVDNWALGIGGGIFVRNSLDDPEVSIFNSIVAGNIDNGTAPDLGLDFTSILSVNYSLIGDTTNGLSSTLLAVVANGTENLQNIDPLLGPLADNGGPTQTHALLTGSPAIDAGRSTQTTDQRGFALPVDFVSVPNASDGNGADIGAFETQTPSSSTFVPGDVTAFFETDSDIDLSAMQFIYESGAALTVTLTASAGAFAAPADGSGIGAGVTAALSHSQIVTLAGTARDLNVYFDNHSNLQYTPLPGAAGDNAAAISVTVDSTLAGIVYVDVAELPTLIVTTVADIIDPLDHLRSLREAITTANSTFGADIITFDANVFSGGEASLIRLAGAELEISEPLTIDGKNGFDITITGDTDDDDVTDDANVTNTAASFSGTVGATDDLLDDNTRVFNFTTNTGDLTLSGLTITGGRTTGDNQSSFAVRTYSGGGIRFLSEGTLTLVDSTVSGNSTVGNDADGGGIFAIIGAVTLNCSTVSGNSTAGTNASGGGIHAPNGAVMLTESTVTENTTTGRLAHGGGIDSSLGAVLLTSSTVSRNFSYWGGGIFTSSGAVTLTNSTVNRNGSTASAGGGIYTFSGAVTLTNSTVSSNSTAGMNASGGGIYTSRGEVTLTKSAVTGNSTAGTNSSGGGIYTGPGTVTITSSTVSGNSTAGTNASGGGIYASTGRVTLTNSTVSGNSSGNDGGGIFGGTAVTLTSSTVSGNTSGHDGGGIIAGRELTLTSSTVTENTAANGVAGGVFVLDTSIDPEFRIRNSIVGGNIDNGDAPDIQPDPDSTLNIDYSLIGDTTGSSIDGNTGVGNLLNVDSLLGPLANNGGLTLTHMPMVESPVIDKGNPSFASPPDYDQRGFAFERVIGGRIDIGAIESEATSADFDSDGDIDGTDFLRWQRGFGVLVPIHSNGDADLDGIVDSSDLALWSSNYPQVAASVSGGQPTMTRHDLTDAAMAWELLDGTASNDEKLIFAESAILDAIVSVDEVPLRVRTARITSATTVDLADDSAEADASDEAWLSVELLERIFG